MKQSPAFDKKQRPPECSILNPSALLRQAIAEDSNRVSDWEWYIEQLKDDAERLYCFERILYINLTHRAALKAILLLNTKRKEKLADQRNPPLIMRLFRLWMRVGS